jgi:hypothetical protein
MIKTAFHIPITSLGKKDNAAAGLKKKYNLVKKRNP